MSFGLIKLNSPPVCLCYLIVELVHVVQVGRFVAGLMRCRSMLFVECTEYVFW